jgi:hypothetical protein
MVEFSSRSLLLLKRNAIYLDPYLLSKLDSGKSLRSVKARWILNASGPMVNWWPQDRRAGRSLPEREHFRFELCFTGQLKLSALLVPFNTRRARDVSRPAGAATA